MSPDYFSPIDHTGRRSDHYSRPELNSGVVDFAVPRSEYQALQPQPRLIPLYAPSPDTPHLPLNKPDSRSPVPLHLIFLIDVCANNEFLPSICDAIRNVLYGGSPNEPWNLVDPAMQVAFLTFDGSLHFWSISVSRQTTMLLLYLGRLRNSGGSMASRRLRCMSSLTSRTCSCPSEMASLQTHKNHGRSSAVLVMIMTLSWTHQRRDRGPPRFDPKFLWIKSITTLCNVCWPSGCSCCSGN